uniref:Uncharacterized protein n=1 Tax=Arundo donax TaxID=35708 RepID=A0A0A9F5G9_ARUDO
MNRLQSCRSPARIGVEI